MCLVPVVIPAFLEAAPAPTKPPPFFPTQIGTKWVYDCDGKEHSEELTTAVREPNQVVVHIALAFPDAPENRRYWVEVAVSDAGVSIVADAHLPRSEAPIRWVKADARVGEKWGVDTWHKIGQSDSMVKAVMSYEGFEKVKVPAGEFMAMRIKSRNITGYPSRERWYARGVGLVRSANLEGGQVKALKSFIPGKK